MKASEILLEYSRSRPVVCVDVQPSYMQAVPKDYPVRVGKFLANHRGPILMYVNADETGMTDDNIEHDIYPFWEEIFEHNGDDFYEDGLPKMEFFDKGYGYLRGWLDQGVDSRIIIQVIREMYRQKVYSSEELFNSAWHTKFDGDSDKLLAFIKHICGGSLHRYCTTPSTITSDPIYVGWVALNRLKQYNNCYLIGGGRSECLKEISLMMNAFNIKYTLIDSLIYGQ